MINSTSLSQKLIEVADLVAETLKSLKHKPPNEEAFRLVKTTCEFLLHSSTLRRYLDNHSISETRLSNLISTSEQPGFGKEDREYSMGAAIRYLEQIEKKSREESQYI